MPSRRQFLGTSAALASGTGTWLASAGGADAQQPDAPQPPPAVPLRPTDTPDRFDFETDAIEGTIRLDGDYHGVSRLVDKCTGRQVIDPRYSALNLFKLHSVNHYLGMPRTMPRTTTAQPTAVQVSWPPTEAHLGQITARYEVRQPNAVDVTVTFRSQWQYRGYEIFMPNYFDKVLVPHVYVKPWKLSPDPDLIVPTVNDAFRGAVLVFARDANAAQLCVDGRWERKEGKTPFVQMCPVRHYGRCLAFYSDPEATLAAVVMSRPRQCYAVSTRYHADKEEDRPTSYSAADFSLFGDDVAAGDVRSARLRLALTPLDANMSQPFALYQQFLAETEDEPPAPPSSASS